MGVILVDFLLQHGDTAQGAFQTFSGAHNTDVIPHEQPQLMPVMLDNNQFIWIFYPAFIPARSVLTPRA
jgi:hypothetical protein